MSDEIPERQLPFQEKQPRKLNYQERVRAGIQRGGLNPTSKKKEEWLKKYRKQKQLDQEYQVCFVCGVTEHKDNMEPHHTHGRSNENIMKYQWVHTECHAWIHKNPNEARKKGYLFF
jgi:disulfide oxidoreductase YuzD